MTSPRTTAIWVGRRLPPCGTGRPGHPGASPCTAHKPFSDASVHRRWGISSGPARCTDRSFAFKASESTNPFHSTLPWHQSRPADLALPPGLAPLHHSPRPPALHPHHRDFQTRLAWTRTPQLSPVRTGETVAASAQAAWEAERGPWLTAW